MHFWFCKETERTTEKIRVEGVWFFNFLKPSVWQSHALFAMIGWLNRSDKVKKVWTFFKLCFFLQKVFYYFSFVRTGQQNKCPLREVVWKCAPLFVYLKVESEAFFLKKNKKFEKLTNTKFQKSLMGPQTCVVVTVSAEPRPLPVFWFFGCISPNQWEHKGEVERG